MNRLSKVAVIFGALLIWYTLVGFLIAPALLRHFVEAQLQQNFSPDSAITKVRMNPYSASLRVEGLYLADTAGAWSVAWAEAEVNVGAATFVKFYPVLDALRLVGADVRYEKRVSEVEEVVEVAEDEASGDWRALIQELNLVDIPELRVELLEVADGRIDFLDLTNPEPYSNTLAPINFTLRDLTTVTDGDSEMSFMAETDQGAQLTWVGNFQSHPIRSEGRFVLTSLPVHDLSPYFSEFIRFNLQSTYFALSFDYALNLGDLEKLIRLQSGQVSLTEVRCEITDASDRVISVDSIVADGLDFAFPQMKLGVASVRITDGETRIIRDAGGEINLSRLIALPPKLEEEAVVEEPSERDLPPFTYQVDEIAFTNYSVTWEDAVDASQANLTVVVPHMQITDLNSDLETPFMIDGEYLIGDSGVVKVEGSAVSEGPVLELELLVDSLPLDILSPYAESYADTRIAAGDLGFSGHLNYAGEGAQALTGDLSVDGIELFYAQSLQAKWAALKLNGLNLNLASFSLELDSISLEQPDMTYTLAASEPEAEPVEPPVESATVENAGESVPVRIDNIKISEGRFMYIDRSFEPASEVVIDALSLNMTGLDAASDSPASLNLSAQLNGSALEVDGEINVNDLKETTRLKARLSGLKLVEFSPYAGRAVGRAIDNGQLSIEADWDIENKQLKATNKITINGFSFGGSVPSENAVSLPLDLAVMMLQGPNGVMDISLPLSGDLSDPKVGVWQIVRTAAVGLITNVAAAPFKMLSGLVSGSEEDLSIVIFDAGSAKLTPAMVHRLQTLAAALKERPRLELEIRPQLSQADEVILSENKLRLDLLGDSDLGDEKLYRKLLSKRYRETMRGAGTPDSETDADNDDGFEKMVAALLPGVVLDDTDRAALAAARTAAIRENLMTIQGIAAERLSSGEFEVDASESAVQFNLR